MSLSFFYLIGLIRINIYRTIDILEPPPFYSYFIRNPSERFKASSYCKLKCPLLRTENLGFGESPLGFTATTPLTQEQASLLKNKLQKAPLDTLMEGFSYDDNQPVAFNISSASRNFSDSRPDLQSLRQDLSDYEQSEEGEEETSDASNTSPTQTTESNSLTRPRFRTRKSSRQHPHHT